MWKVGLQIDRIRRRSSSLGSSCDSAEHPFLCYMGSEQLRREHILGRSDVKPPLTLNHVALEQADTSGRVF